MMLLDLQKDIIYGPVNSRRLGQSLGINLLPPRQKACPFNCIYCQYGWTEIHQTERIPHLSIPSLEEVRKALIKALSKEKEPPDYITFSGNGEPTLHPDFGQIVRHVISIRNELAPKAKTAILSNSALVSRKHIRDAIEKLDVRIMKLDCGTPQMFKKYNQPCSGISLDEITKGLSLISGITIQTLVSSGKSGNIDSYNIKEWIRRLKRIRPICVQLYTIDRGYPTKELRPASRKELNRIKQQLVQAGISAKVY